jgi:hypothetical protein
VLGNQRVDIVAQTRIKLARGVEKRVARGALSDDRGMKDLACCTLALGSHGAT